jgi:hypothetical protein
MRHVRHSNIIDDPHPIQFDCKSVSYVSEQLSPMSPVHARGEGVKGRAHLTSPPTKTPV